MMNSSLILTSLMVGTLICSYITVRGTSDILKSYISSFVY